MKVSEGATIESGGRGGENVCYMHSNFIHHVTTNFYTLSET